MSEAIETIEHESGLVARVYYDTDPMPPDDWDAPDDAPEREMYANGDVYVVSIETESGEGSMLGVTLDACGSFYGYEYAIEQGREMLEYDAARVQREQSARSYWESRDVVTI